VTTAKAKLKKASLLYVKKTGSMDEQPLAGIPTILSNMEAVTAAAKLKSKSSLLVKTGSMDEQ
jgi:hypothetical protein